LGAFPTRRFGRKTTLFWIGVLYTVSAIGSAFANDPIVFAMFRFVGGLGVGISTIAAPAYISEIAPPKDRGRLVGLYQFNLVFGILLAFLSNYMLSDIGENAWRWMMGVEAFPAIIFTFLCLTIPKSPRWLITRGATEEAKAIYAQVDPEGSFDQLVQEINNSNSSENKTESIFNKKYRFPLKLAFLVAFFNQLSGINAFLYYAPRIFEEGGLGESTSLLSSVGIGVTNLIFTYIGISLIDKKGRRSLMYYGSFGYIISLSLVACAFFFQWGGLMIPYFLISFYCFTCYRSGSDYLGVYFRNIPQSFKKFWAIFWDKCSLGFGCNYSLVCSLAFWFHRCRSCLFYLCVFYGFTTFICSLYDA
jgi:sugar porter (SP) family MFS transporter